MNAIIVFCMAILATASAIPSLDHHHHHHNGNGSRPIDRNATESSNLPKVRTGHKPFAPKDMSEVKGIPYEEYLKVSSSKRAANAVACFPANGNADWRQTGAIGPVLDQGDCGSCWTFASTNSLSASYFIKYGNYIEFSQEQLVDCSSEVPNDGCDGGNEVSAFSYYTGGAATSESYPYLMSNWEEGDDPKGTCTYSRSMAVAYTNAQNPYVYLNQYHLIGNTYHALPVNLTALIDALYCQPVAVTICAYLPDFMSFEGPGAFIPTLPCDGSSTNQTANHAVFAVAYFPQEQYITIKNSWNTWWGVGGFANISVAAGTPGAQFFSDASFPNVQ